MRLARMAPTSLCLLCVGSILAGGCRPDPGSLASNEAGVAMPAAPPGLIASPPSIPPAPPMSAWPVVTTPARCGPGAVAGSSKEFDQEAIIESLVLIDRSPCTGSKGLGTLSIAFRGDGGVDAVEIFGPFSASVSDCLRKVYLQTHVPPFNRPCYVIGFGVDLR